MLEFANSSATPAIRPAALPLPLPAVDQRGHARYLLRLAITMQGDNNFYSGLSENISESGIFIATHVALPIGTLVVMSFTLPHADAPISVVGRVQWLRRPDATASDENIFGGGPIEIKPGMGVQFTEVDPRSADSIRAFMRARGPEFFA